MEALVSAKMSRSGNQCEDESFQMFADEQEDQEPEECANGELAVLKEAWFDHVQENQWTNGCENEGQEDQEQEEASYRSLDFLGESFVQDVSGGSSAMVVVVQETSNLSREKLKEKACDTMVLLTANLNVMVAETRVLQAKIALLENKAESLKVAKAEVLKLEARLKACEARAAAANARTLELEGIVEKQNKHIDELEESLEIMTEWVIEIKQPETENWL